MKTVMSRAELCEHFNISRTHLVRKLKKFGIEPMKSTLHTQKLLYLVSEVEKGFNLKINKEDSEEKAPDQKAMDDIGDILKEE